MAQREQVGQRESMIDWEKVDEVTLALMQLTTFEDHGLSARGKATTGMCSTGFMSEAG
jgi:hypothetical protein